MIPSLGIISQRHIILPSFFQDIWWKLTNGIRQNVSLVKNTPRKRGVKNSISDIYHTHFSLYYKLEVLQIFRGSHSIHMKAFPVMLVHLFRRTGIGEQPLLAFSETCFLSLSLRQFIFLCHLRNLPDFLLMTLDCVFSVLSAHGSKKAGL